MSLFTASATSSQPACERCKKAQFVILVKRGEVFSVWDCRGCGPVVNKRSTGSNPR